MYPSGATATTTNTWVVTYTITQTLEVVPAWDRVTSDQIWYDAHPRHDPLREALELLDVVRRMLLDQKQRFRAFVLARSPWRPELEPEDPPPRAIVSRRTALRASARGVRNWRPRR